ncbi:hypothetical protein GCM10029964_098050 [Kibdelosporangium lantanae]
MVFGEISEGEMGTFGTGPFSSDGALDFLDELGDRPAEGRHRALADVFTHVLANGDLLGREFFADEVVAAAAIVAAGLPGGEHLRQLMAEAGQDQLAETPPAPTPDLAAPALEALLFVAGPGRPWHEGWSEDTDRLEAQHTVDDLSAILRAANP